MYAPDYKNCVKAAQHMIDKLIYETVRKATDQAIKEGTIYRMQNSPSLDDMYCAIDDARDMLVDIPSEGVDKLVEGLAAAIYLKEIGCYYPE